MLHCSNQVFVETSVWLTCIARKIDYCCALESLVDENCCTSRSFSYVSSEVKYCLVFVAAHQLRCLGANGFYSSHQRQIDLGFQFVLLTGFAFDELRKADFSVHVRGTMIVRPPFFFNSNQLSRSCQPHLTHLKNCKGATQ